MGSLGPVKALRDKRPAEVTKNLVKDISNISNISNKSIKMGNLCSAGPSAAAKKVLTIKKSRTDSWVVSAWKVFLS